MRINGECHHLILLGHHIGRDPQMAAVDGRCETSGRTFSFKADARRGCDVDAHGLSAWCFQGNIPGNHG